MTPLRQRMIEDMQVRNLSPHTLPSYVQQVSLFARHFDQSPEALGPEEIRSYQVYLTKEKKLAPSSILTAVAALRFLYRITLHKDWTLPEIIPAPKKPQKLPIVLSPEEVLQFLGCVTSPKHRTILTTCYAAGLRISEAVRLKPTHLDSQRMVIRVELGKGQRDRYVMLPPQAVRNPARVVAAGETQGVALPRRYRRPTHYLGRCRIGVPGSASSFWHLQTHNSTLFEARIFRTSARARN